MNRMTLKNPSDNGYRLPFSRSGEWRMENKGQFSDIYGDPINRLGQYEDLGMEPDEIRRELEMAARYRQLLKVWEKEKK